MINLNDQSPNEQINIGIRSIRFIANSNATENIDKVKNCFSFFLPDGFIKSKIKITSVSGMYNNPIKMLDLIINKQKDIDYSINKIANSLDEEDKEKITKEFFMRFSNKGELFIRFKKTDVSLGEVNISDKSDVIKITITFFNKKTGGSKKLNSDKIKEYLVQIGLTD